VDIRKNLDELIDYELTIDITLDKALDELLTRSDIPWKISAPAWDKQSESGEIHKTTIEKIAPLHAVPRRQVIELLLAKYPTDSADNQLRYVIRPDGVEITTRRAYLNEFFPGRKATNPSPLVYAVFDKVPLPDALAELGRTTGNNVVLAGRLVEASETKITADLTGVPLDTAVVLLADMADLKLVRLGTVYYVTSRERARLLETEEQERLLKEEKEKGDPAKPQADKAELKK